WFGIERRQKIALPQLVAGVDDDGCRRTLVCRDNLHDAGGMLARGSGAGAAAHAVMAAHHEILSNLEAVQRAAIERELVVFRIQLAIGFVAMRTDRPERLGPRAGAGLCRSANGLAVVDRHRDDDWRRRRR